MEHEVRGNLRITVDRMDLEHAVREAQHSAEEAASWAAEAASIQEELPQTIAEILDEAKESGKFDGPPGETGPAGPAGPSGADGVSPSASVSKAGNVVTLTVTDREGTTTATLRDGVDGEPGPAGADGISPSASVSKTGDTATVTITDRSGTTSVTLTDGADGADGISPSASVSKSGDTATVTITDRSGTTSVTLTDGAKGDKGDKGDPGTTDWNDLQNKPAIPEKLSDLEDDTEETVTGATVSITAEAGKRYVCTAAAVTEMVFEPCASGLCEVIFVSGTTPTVLTLPSAVKMPSWWTGPQASTIYDIMILNGTYGAVMAWTA